MAVNKREMKRGTGASRKKVFRRTAQSRGHLMALEPALNKAEWKQASSTLAVETYLVNRAGESI